LKSITFVADPSVRAQPRASIRARPGKSDSGFPIKTVLHHSAGASGLPARLVQQHSGDWAMTGKVPVARVEGQAPLPVLLGRMEAIQDTKTMAGSPDADIAMRSASRNLAHGFCVLRCHAFREPMKEKPNVQYSFSRNRLGWASPQA
jgi:hypothetical protein